MLKGIGAILVVISCTGLGFLKTGDYKQRIAELTMLKRMLLLLRGEIKYAKTPLPEAFAHIGERMCNCFGGFLTELAKQMEGENNNPFKVIWEQAIREKLTNTRLVKDDKEQLRRMGESLGYLDSEMQIATIDLQIEQLEDKLAALEKEMGVKTKVYNCLGIFCGLMIAILFV